MSRISSKFWGPKSLDFNGFRRSMAPKRRYIPPDTGTENSKQYENRFENTTRVYKWCFEVLEHRNTLNSNDLGPQHLLFVRRLGPRNS